MRLILYISLLLALASCSTQLTGPQPPQPGVPPASLSSYFWPDSTATYLYRSSTGDLQTISVFAGGNIIDKDEHSGASTTLTITKTSASYGLTGFSPTDIIGFDPGLQVVSDTALPAPHVETIRSIAAINPDSPAGFGALFAASDSVLYQIDLHRNAIVRLNALPMNGLTLAEDASGSGLYAFQSGGNHIYWIAGNEISGNGMEWKSYSTPPGTAITAFASAPGKGHSDDLFWVACDSQLYRFSKTSHDGSLVRSPIDHITALEAATEGVIAAGSDGSIYGITHSGQATLLTIAPGNVRGIAANYITTASGVYDFIQTAPPVVAGDDSAIYFYASPGSSDASIFAARSDGSVDYFGRDVPPVTLPAPKRGSKVTQFAFPYQGMDDRSKGIYVVAGGQVFYRQDAETWQRVDQTLSAPASFTPGAFTLLHTDSTWTAGFVESTSGGIPHGYTYQAVSSGPFAQMTLDGTAYQSVLIVHYSSQTNGMADTTNMPQYTIYFEKGIGPNSIERSENGIPVITKLLR